MSEIQFDDSPLTPEELAHEAEMAEQDRLEDEAYYAGFED